MAGEFLIVDYTDEGHACTAVGSRSRSSIMALLGSALTLATADFDPAARPPSASFRARRSWNYSSSVVELMAA